MNVLIVSDLQGRQLADDWWVANLYRRYHAQWARSTSAPDVSYAHIEEEYDEERVAYKAEEVADLPEQGDGIFLVVVRVVAAREPLIPLVTDGESVQVFVDAALQILREGVR